MAMCSLGTRPLINKPKYNSCFTNSCFTIDQLSETLDDDTKQAWYADDSDACEKLESLLKWWNMLTDIGSLYGYFPNAKKTVLIVKGRENLLKAQQFFGVSGVKITDIGERHLGAVVGDNETKNKSVSIKVIAWVDDVTRFAEISKDDPLLAYIAFTKG
jgi:hypothetical protein